MAKAFIERIPKKPILKRQTYCIPESYSEAYSKADIKTLDEQMVLFHLTQFGGFRLKRFPKNWSFNGSFLNQWTKGEFKSGYHIFKASADFIKEFGDINIRPLERTWNQDPFNYDEMKESGFTQDEIHDSYKFLRALNNFYSTLRVDINLPKSGITPKDRIQLSKMHSIPYLIKKPKAGGRFFHPETSYQRISSSLRPFLTINGKKTSELDLSAATLQFFNIGLQKYTNLSIEEAILSHEDPYNYFLSVLNSDDFLKSYREQQFDREGVKDIVYTMIYSPENRRKTYLNNKLRFAGRNFKFDDIKPLFPEFFNSLSALEGSTSLPLHMIINKEESNYAQHVLQTGCLDYAIPILPIHDSFITTKSNVTALTVVMGESAKNLYGKPLVFKKKF